MVKMLIEKFSAVYNLTNYRALLMKMLDIFWPHKNKT